MPNYDYTSYFESPALYVDFSRLAPPKVIETIDYETLVKLYQARVVAKLPVLATAVTMEQSPTNVILQTEAYGEMMVRARVNDAARAVMLPFATGSDLDVLGAFYDEERPALVDTPRGSVDLYPADWLDDASYRRIIQLSPEAFSTAGSEGAYIYHSLKAAPTTLRDASAARLGNRGGVRVALMSRGNAPEATADQIQAVSERLYSKNIRPLTDVPSVVGCNVIYVDLQAVLTLYPGPDQALVLSSVQDALTRLRSRLAMLGRDLTRAGLMGALYQEGVQNVAIVSPTGGDIVVGPEACVFIRSVSVGTSPLRMD